VDAAVARAQPVDERAERPLVPDVDGVVVDPRPRLADREEGGADLAGGEDAAALRLDGRGTAGARAVHAGGERAPQRGRAGGGARGAPGRARVPGGRGGGGGAGRLPACAGGAPPSRARSAP